VDHNSGGELLLRSDQFFSLTCVLLRGVACPGMSRKSGFTSFLLRLCVVFPVVVAAACPLGEVACPYKVRFLLPIFFSCFPSLFYTLSPQRMSDIIGKMKETGKSVGEGKYPLLVQNPGNIFTQRNLTL
jgi:hypothetical protein